MKKPPPIHAVYVACLLFACGGIPSRAPLGGNYALPETAPAADRRAPDNASASPQPNAANSQPVTPAAAPSTTPKAEDAGAVARAKPTDTIHFQPLQRGSRIKAEITLSTSAEMRGGPSSMPGRGTLSLESRLRAEIQVLQASAHRLDELDLTLTTLSMHTTFGGQDVDSKQEPPETYRITLSGSSPTIRPARGSGTKVSLEERVKLALFVVPLAEFYAHWADSPALELEPGWTSKVSLPFVAALFPIANDETLRVGPLSTRFASRAEANEEVAFELALPASYGGKLGKIEFDLSGSAKLNAKSGRPMTFELSGPLTASGGPQNAQLRVLGAAKLACTLNYP